MNTTPFAGARAVAVILLAAASLSVHAEALSAGLYAVIHTKRGVITAELFPEKTPLTVANFVGLAEGTISFENRPAETPFYDGLVFHRVVPGFVIQGGDPLGTGEGGPGYSIADEFVSGVGHVRGALAMANDGPNSNGSQFYFAIEEVHRLNYKHTVFGVVRTGMEVVTAMEEGDAMDRVEIVRVGPAAESFRPNSGSFAAQRSAARVLKPRDAALPPLFASEAALELPEWFPKWIEEKLNHYHQLSGTQIFVRLFKKFSAIPGESPLALPGLFSTLSEGDERTCLLVFLEDELSWRIWLGDNLISEIGGPGAGSDTDAGREALHATKASVLESAKIQIGQGHPRRSIDAAVTSLISFLDGKSVTD